MTVSLAEEGRRPIVLLVSDIHPSDTSGGHVVLHRHLQTYRVMTPPQSWNSFRLHDLLRRAAGWWERYGWKATAARINYANKARWIDRRASELAEQCDLILTVAQGDAFESAVRLSQGADKPLVAIFHDWWPDMVPPSLRARVEKRFRELYAAADLALCVSPALREALGPHTNSHVLLPIPGLRNVPGKSFDPGEREHRPLRITYSGNLSEYGAMLRGALGAIEGSSDVRLEVRGSPRDWPEEEIERRRTSGTLLPFADREAFHQWLESADAFLIAMSFEPTMRRRMETSFPSKLCEFAQYGKPLVIWGPEYCTAVRWARDGKKALWVTSPDATILRDRLRELARNIDELQRLSRAAMAAAMKEFCAIAIQRRFDDLLADTMPALAAKAVRPRHRDFAGTD